MNLNTTMTMEKVEEGLKQCLPRGEKEKVIRALIENDANQALVQFYAGISLQALLTEDYDLACKLAAYAMVKYLQAHPMADDDATTLEVAE